MSEQAELFDVSRTTVARCQVAGCEALRYPDQDRTPTCRHDRDRALGEPGWRPAGCLNRIDPAHQEIPF